jgi:putative ribosome biogenesis GTPase RsgA
VYLKIKTYITSTANYPCVLFGESGTGKSSIMAKLVYEVRKKIYSSFRGNSYG